MKLPLDKPRTSRTLGADYNQEYAMKIPLSEIKGSTPRVRQSQSPEKLDELAQSIREEGVIVPVKVRKNGTGYTLVYGHRRVAAAKQAGLKEIEAIVEDVPEKKLLTQALVENVVREDMPDLEIAKALQGILNDTGCTHAELAAKMGWMSDGAVRKYLAMLVPELGLGFSKKPLARAVTTMHVGQATAGTDNLQDAAKVLNYAIENELSARETRQVAEVTAQASRFGGAKAVNHVLTQRPGAIFETAETLPARKLKPRATVREAEGKLLFQWIKDPRVLLAEEGVKAISACVSAIARGTEDRAGGKIVLKALRRSIAQVLAQIEGVGG